jgi:4-diphosphocytidyl-2-C-methyl-D-erythritol kinase
MSIAPRQSPLRFLCPAKVNLHLRVGPLRDDRFHPLLSWMCTVGLYDTLEMRLSGVRSADVPDSAVPRRIDISLQCEPPGLACDDRNLVVRVAKAWQSGDTRSEGAVIQARLTKRTPVGAGLGGGSSDAARMILALNRLFPGEAGEQSPGELTAFAARFGSDVPFFLAGPSSVCAGRGEIVRPIGKPRPRWAVLVLPKLMMPTPEVYRRFDSMGLGRLEDINAEPNWAHWATLDALSLLPLLVNDLEAPAFSIRPELRDLRIGMEQVLNRPVRMSGSGSSLFTLYDDAAEARFAVRTLVGSPGNGESRVEAVELSPSIHDDLEPPGALKPTFQVDSD